MTQQSLTAALVVVVTFVTGILSSSGFISKETATYLVGPETLAFLGVVALVALAAYSWCANRAHAQIAATAALPQVDAVITKPKTADEVQVGNVVGSLTEASRVPGVGS